MKAFLAKTTTDMMKSKMLSPQVSQLVLEVYISPSEFASIIDRFDDQVFEVEFKESK